MGLGIVVRNYEGVVLASLCATRKLVSDSRTTEALAVWQAA